jgi:CDP-4-dehydro-6-deoxyglucose reductase
MTSFQIIVEPFGSVFAVQSDQTILEGAMAAGWVLPHSCRSGACSTCKGRVLSGEVDAGALPAQVLSPEELAEGYTLFCQARPRTDLKIELREIRSASAIQIRKLPARVHSLTRLADDIMVAQLQLPASEPLRYYAGQYVEIIMKDGVRRRYSMANAPHTGSPLELHIRHLPGGRFTDHVFGAGQTQMKEREILRMEGPFGSFFLREESTKPIILLASGTGFAPVQAIVQHMQHIDNQRPTVLYWGGRRPQDLYLTERARQWQASMTSFRYVPVISDALPQDGWTGRGGLVHEAVLADVPDMTGYEVYACGAPVMVEAARRNFCAHGGLPPEAFFADAFTSEADLAKS